MSAPRPLPLYGEQSPSEADEAQPTELGIGASKIAACEALAACRAQGIRRRRARSPLGRGPIQSPETQFWTVGRRISARLPAAWEATADERGPRGPQVPYSSPVMNRRTFLAMASASLLATPLAAEAQPAGKVRG